MIFFVGCEKEAEDIFDPDYENINDNINLNPGNSKCAYDVPSKTFYFPATSDTVIKIEIRGYIFRTT
jgi:hypothetical protein